MSTQATPLKLTKKTAASVLGFKSVRAFNATMRHLGFFNQQNEPASTYTQQGLFTTEQRQHALPGYNITRSYTAVQITQKGLEAIQQTLQTKKD